MKTFPALFFLLHQPGVDVSDVSEVKDSILFWAEGQGHLSSLSNPQTLTSSSGISPGTLEKWFVSRAPH